MRIAKPLVYSALLSILAGPAAAAVLPACPAADMPSRGGSCVYTGDTGWHEGEKWRLRDIDAPEISSRRARCRAEQIKGVKARDRLRLWLARGYTVLPSGQSDSDGTPLVSVRLSDGRDLARQLMSEDLVEAAPNTGNRWCGHDWPGVWSE